MGRRDLNRGKKTLPSASKNKTNTTPSNCSILISSVGQGNLLLRFIWDQGIDIIFAQEMEKISVTLEMVRLRHFIKKYLFILNDSTKIVYIYLYRCTYT